MRSSMSYGHILIVTLLLMASCCMHTTTASAVDDFIAKAGTGSPADVKTNYKKVIDKTSGTLWAGTPPKAKIKDINEQYGGRLDDVIGDSGDTAKYFTALNILRQAYVNILAADVTDVCTSLPGKISQIESAKDTGAYITQVFALKTLKTDAVIGAKDPINFYELIAGYHQAHLCFPTPITTTTAAEKKAYVLMNEQFAALLPTVTDRLVEAKAEIARTAGKTPATDQDTFIYFEPVPSPENLFDLEKNYAWKRALLNPALPVPSGGPTSFPSASTNTAPSELDARTAFDKVKTAYDEKWKTKLSAAALKQSDVDDIALLLQGIHNRGMTELKDLYDKTEAAIPTATAITDKAAASSDLLVVYISARLDAPDYFDKLTTDPIAPGDRTQALKDRKKALEEIIRIKKAKTDSKDILGNKALQYKEEVDPLYQALKKELVPTTKSVDDELNKALVVALKAVEDAKTAIDKLNLPSKPATPVPGPSSGTPSGSGTPPAGPGAPPVGGPSTGPVPQGPVQKKELDEEFALTPPQVDAGCKDEALNCRMRLCSIPGYVEAMHQKCKKTCKRCMLPGEQCVDKNPSDCATWQAQKYCESHLYSKAIKMEQCAATCGLCPPAGRR